MKNSFQILNFSGPNLAITTVYRPNLTSSPVDVPKQQETKIDTKQSYRYMSPLLPPKRIFGYIDFCINKIFQQSLRNAPAQVFCKTAQPPTNTTTLSKVYFSVFRLEIVPVNSTPFLSDQPPRLGHHWLQGARIQRLCQGHRGEALRHPVGQQDAFPGGEALCKSRRLAASSSQIDLILKAFRDYG